MFFHISKTKQDNFPHNHQTANFFISLDEGWNHIYDQNNNDIWYKGYLDYNHLADKVLEISEELEPQYTGNFCVIKVFDSGISIKSNKFRGFPIWYDKNLGLTNLRNIGQQCWADSYVSLGNNLELTESKFDAIGKIDTSNISLDQLLDQYDQLLDKKAQHFLSNKSINVYLSGGVDSALLLSYIQKHTDNYKFILETHIEYDYFFLKNEFTLGNFWGYKQIHHWRKPSILSSGTSGDEFTGRNPLTVDPILRAHGTNFIEVMHDSRFANSLNYDFFKLNYYDKLNKPDKTLSLEQAIYQGCNHNNHDCQHWHLGNTLTWTPMRDLEFFKLVARLPVEDIKQQLMNSIIQVKLIERNNPEILSYTSPKKNINDRENITKLLKYV